MIEVERELGDAPTKWVEHCCFCARKTRYWHLAKDVAVCLSCAEVRQASDVPSKAEWCRSPQAHGHII